MNNLFCRTFLYSLIIGTLGLFSVGCDSAPGIPGGDESAPVISSLEFAPAAVNLDTLPAGSIIDGIATFSIDVEVTIDNGTTGLESLFLFVLPPDSRSDTAAETVINLTAGGTVSTTLRVSLPAAETGIYTVKAFVSDKSGQLGNQATGSLNISASSSPPVIESVDIPAMVVRPAEGEPPILIPIIARVSDPDGAGNILRVQVMVNGDRRLFLCDDGGVGQCNAGFPPSGDAEIGDSLYTLTIQVDAINALGDNEFIFIAIDRSGLESEEVLRTIIVQ